MDFVRHLHDIHADACYGFLNTSRADQDRCMRWMDAVLPEAPTVVQFELPDDPTLTQGADHVA
jgi:hypothetical protein